MWHSQETAHDRPHTDSNGVLAWYWESVNPTLTFPTQRSAAVPWDSSRLQAEEDVKYRAISFGMLTLSVSSLIGNICLEINIDNDDKITLGL